MRFFLAVCKKVFNFAATIQHKEDIYGKSNRSVIGSAIQQLP